MKHKNSHLLVGYWNRLRHDGDVPDQTDIDPRAIKRLLCNVFILDAGVPGRPFYRLAGTALCERYGLELKGMGFLGNWEGRSAEAVSALLRQSLKLRQPVCLASVASTADCGAIELETILAPICHGTDRPTRFLGMTQILGDPSQLGGRPILTQRLVGTMMVSEEGPFPRTTLPPVPPPPVQRNRAPHLRLVVSQERPEPFHFEGDEAMRRLLALITQPGSSI